VSQRIVTAAVEVANAVVELLTIAQRREQAWKTRPEDMPGDMHKRLQAVNAEWDKADQRMDAAVAAYKTAVNQEAPPTEAALLTSTEVRQWMARVDARAQDATKRQPHWGILHRCAEAHKTLDSLADGLQDMEAVQGGAVPSDDR
jgi:hypothetical protein